MASPRTPTRRRVPPSIDVDASPSSPSSPTQDSHSRRSSLQASSPITPRTPGASLGRELSMSSGLDGAGRGGGFSGNGLGSLADELADADEWEEGEEEDGDEEEVQRPGEEDVSNDRGSLPPDSGIDVASSPALPGAKGELATRSKHRRKTSRYDGSDYGDPESDLEEASGMSSTLEARLAGVEELARRGLGGSGTLEDGAIARVIDSLKDLGPQSSVENGATRLITSHTALSTHLAHQTRTLNSLTFALLSPLSAAPSLDLIESLLPLLATITSSIPQPTRSALSSLSSLSALTADLVSTLDHLSDTLHMSRQTTTAATRKLRSARDLVDTLRREAEARDEGVRWLERGDWGRRLEARECGSVCRDVVGGFEDVCQGWRERLVAAGGGAEGVGAA